MKTRSKISTMTASPSVKRKLKRNTNNENGHSTEVLDGIIKTPKTKSRAEAVTPVRDDIMCSQHFDSQADVGWDCNSPDTLKHIQKISNKDGISSDLDNIMKLIIEEEPGQQVRNSESPPLLGVWKHSIELEKRKQHHQQRSRNGKRRWRMRHLNASDTLVSRELLQKLTMALQKCSDSKPLHNEMDSESCSRFSISDDTPKEELEMLHDRSGDLFESDMFQRTVINDKIEKPKPVQEVVTLSETFWSDEELFEDNSFIIKATQYPQDGLKISGSPEFVCNKRKLSEEGNVENIKSPRYVEHASSSLVFQDSKSNLIKDTPNQQVKILANKSPTGKCVVATGQKNYVILSKTGSGSNPVINDICKYSNLKKDRNVGYGKSVPGQGPSNINHGNRQDMLSSVHCDPRNMHNSVTNVNGSYISGVNNPCAVGVKSVSSLKVNTSNLFRKHISFPVSEKMGNSTSQQSSGTSRQRLLMGTTQNSLPETKNLHHCNNKSSLMSETHSLDATPKTSHSVDTVLQSETEGTCVGYGYRQTHPISSKQKSGVIDIHHSLSGRDGIAKAGNIQKDQMLNKHKVNNGIKLDYGTFFKKSDNQINPPSNKENLSSECGKKQELKLVEETTDTSKIQSLDTSLTDELLCQLAEPDEILDSQINIVNKYTSAGADFKTSIMLQKPKAMDSKPFHNKRQLKASSSRNALKSESTKVYSFKQSSCMQKLRAQNNSSTSETKLSQEKQGLAPVTDSEDLFLSDDDDVLMEPQTLAMLDEAEWMATQKSEKDYSKIENGNSSGDHKDAKSHQASKDQLIKSQEWPQDCSQQMACSQGTSGSQMQCTPEEIEKKRIEAIKRRQERAAKKPLSLRKQ